MPYLIAITLKTLKDFSAAMVVFKSVIFKRDGLLPKRGRVGY